MRLTLRTMLAYLDDILDSGDARELGQKIDESKFASDLVHRIRNSTRRLRLGAPRPEGKGMGLDANTVAEYLDNTLPAEQVPEFEKVCLESDVHLAEVASCHQILTLVLGEPADVEHAIRERIYEVGTTESRDRPIETGGNRPPHPATIAVGDGEASGGLTDTALARASTSPPPTSTSKRSSLPVKSLAITLVLAFLLALVGLRAIGEFSSSHPVWRLLAGNLDPAAADRLPQESTLADVPTGPALAGPAGTRGGATPQPIPTVVDPPVDRQVQPASGGLDLPANAPIAAPAPAIAREPAAGVQAVDPASVASAPEPSLDGGVVAGEPTTTAGSAGGEATRSAGATVGRYLSEGQVLARWNRAEATWHRLPPDSTLSDGDALLVLPTYRPQVLATGGAKLTLVGPSRLSVEAGGTGDVARLRLQFGRTLVVPASDETISVELDFGERQTLLSLLDIDSAVALEVRRYLPPGSDPEASAPQLVIRLDALSGQAIWQEGGERYSISAGQMLTVLDPEPAVVEAAGGWPDWAQASEWKDIHLRASRELLDYLVSDRPFNLVLMEQSAFERQRRVEVRALASQSLVLLGIYDSILRSLEDARQRAYWADHFRMLRFAMSQGAESAAGLRSSIETQYGENGSTVFRLLRGYSPEQLAAGADSELVQLLEHPEMYIRVLAYLNLESITGMTHLFLPWQPPARERDKVAKWRQSLRSGRIAYKTHPRPLPERVPLAELSDSLP